MYSGLLTRLITLFIVFIMCGIIYIKEEKKLTFYENMHSNELIYINSMQSLKKNYNDMM